ncbi:MAG: hypothetical protein IJG49_02010 [Erysipelotrichaceae bacterium]|nr:hypothetical protein [Erysipelotrichaceae bacterium]
MFRTIITAIGWILIMIIAVVELITFFGLLKRSLYNKRKVCTYMALLALGLFFDAAVLSVGRFVGTGSLLQTLSKVRMIVRGFMIPLILPICAYALDMKNSPKRVFWLLMLACSAAGVVAAVFAKIVPSPRAGIVRYTSSSATPLWADAISMYMPLAIYAILILCGFAMIFKAKTIWILLAGLVVAGLTVVGQFTGFEDLSFLFASFGEMWMLVFFHAYTKKLKKSYL